MPERKHFFLQEMFPNIKIKLFPLTLLASLWSDALGVTAVSRNHPSNPIRPIRHLAFSVLNLSIDLNCINCQLS